MDNEVGFKLILTKLCSINGGSKVLKELFIKMSTII
jgi:hypothetical protein